MLSCIIPSNLNGVLESSPPQMSFPYVMDDCLRLNNLQNAYLIQRLILCISSVQLLSRVWLCDSMDCNTVGLLAHHQLPEYTQTHPSSWWCHPTISSSVVPFSSHLQSFPGSGSFPMSRFFASGGQNIGVSASASVLPMNIQDSFPLGLIGWISLLSKEHPRVFSNTMVQKHQFFGTQLSLQSNSHIHTWPLEKP